MYFGFRSAFKAYKDASSSYNNPFPRPTTRLEKLFTLNSDISDNRKLGSRAVSMIGYFEEFHAAFSLAVLHEGQFVKAAFSERK